MSSPPNSVPDTQLGLTNDEIALLSHHQQVAASGTSSFGTSSRASRAASRASRAASQASSQGLLRLDSTSLVQLSRHFDRLLRQIQARLDYLSEQSQLVAGQQYDRRGNAIAIDDSELARFQDIIRQVDELEGDFDRIRHIRDMVKGYRQRIDEMEQTLHRNTGGPRTPSHRHHGEVKTEHRTVPSHSTPPIQEESDARHPTIRQLAAEKAKAEKVKIDTAEHERQLRRDEREKKRTEAEIKAAAKVAEEKLPQKFIEVQCESCTHTPFRTFETLKKHREEEHDQPFVCIFSFAGCQNIFSSKKEWKLHVSSQHLNSYYWVCELQDCGKVQMQNGKKDEITQGVPFTDKDSITEHLRRTHAFPSVKAPEREKRIQDLLIGCLRGERRLPIYVPCPHCDRGFSGSHCWDSMMDHLAKLKDQTIKEPKGHGFIPWALDKNLIQREPSGKFSLCAIKKHRKHGYQPQERGNVSLLSDDNCGPFSDSGYASMGMNQDLNKEDVEDETQTICTDGQELDIEEGVKRKLVAAFSRETIQHLHSTWAQLDSRRLNMKSLVELLKEFSIRLQFSAKLGQQKDTAVFVRHYRHRIAKLYETSMEGLFQFEDCDRDKEADEYRDKTPGLSLEEKMQLLMWSRQRSDGVGEDNSNLLEIEDADEDYAITHFPEAWKFLRESHAYKWLVGKMKSGILLTELEGTVMAHIGEEISKGLKAASRRYGYTQLRKGFFEILWDLPQFIQDEFPDRNDLQLGSIITITGSCVDAQALTCAEYMHQVWPTTGLDTLKALQETMNQGLMKSHICYLTDNTQLIIQISGSSISVAVNGTVPAIIEIGQQLAWLGSALRPSATSNNISSSEPRISVVAAPDATFELTFQVKEIEASPGESRVNGKCWQPLFRNPVIVKGYPISARNHHERGLELPLNMMAGLGEASRVTNWAGGLVVKGFSTLFCPTARLNNSVLWHYLFEKDGCRISYLSADDRCHDRVKSNSLDAPCLPFCRNFLGWASSIEINTGTKDAKYHNIDWPGSSFATAGVAFEKASIMVGNYVSGGTSFTRGNKDTPIYLHRGGPYQQEIHSACNMNVVLYDTEDRRGWLIDGASALLHITRTQLCSSPYSDSELFKIDSFQHADPRGGLRASRKALMNSGNRSLVLFEEVETSVVSKANVGGEAKAEVKTKTTRWTYQDLVRQTYHILEQLHDYEARMLTTPTISLRLPDREKLTGFAFMDIVDGQNSLRPRVATLKSSGRGWVDFTRSIRAFSLHAKGFGDIIRPSRDANQLCKSWMHVPTGKDYLVACTSTLKELCRRCGNHNSNPMELANGIYWHKPDRLFESCKCNSKSCDRVQVLLPASLGSKRHPQPFGSDDGAVIFGRSNRFPWHWPSKGDPVEAGSSDAEDDESGFHDSGLGSNLSQSGSSPANFGSMSLTSSGSDTMDLNSGDPAALEVSTSSHQIVAGLLGSDAKLDISPGDIDAGQTAEPELGGLENGWPVLIRNKVESRFTRAKRALDNVKGLDVVPQKRRKGTVSKL